MSKTDKQNSDKVLYFGEMLRQLRKKMGYTQIQLAEKVGISPVTLYRYESGQRAPDLNTVIDFANAMEINPGKLFLGNFIETENGRAVSTRALTDVCASELRSLGYELQLRTIEDEEMLLICPDGSSFNVHEQDLLRFHNDRRRYEKMLLLEMRERSKKPPEEPK